MLFRFNTLHGRVYNILVFQKRKVLSFYNGKKGGRATALSPSFFFW